MYYTSASIVTAKELAVLLKVNYSTVTAWARQGKLKSYRMGKCIRFYMRDVERFIIRGRREGGAK